MAYQPIENYGVIGNMRTAALVCLNGSIDWFCYPNFDSPSVFAAILDDHRGGRFRIAATDNSAGSKQFYWPQTNVLVTRFTNAGGIGEVIDYMPAGMPPGEPGFHGLVRRVSVVRGSMQFRMECRPAFDYAREEHTAESVSGGVIFRGRSLQLGLASDRPLQLDGNAAVAAFTLDEGQSASFELHGLEDHGHEFQGLSDEQAHRLFHRTVQFWREWIAHCTYRGRWREMVERSALCMKLLTFEPTGAIVAAPTMSLPENVGGGRNWDYRYTWIRDAAFTVYSFLRIGFVEEAAQFAKWLDQRCHELEPDGSLQVMYGIDGRHKLDEEELSHLEGYRGSRPVRIGNAAYQQQQLDIYGELMDSLYLFNKHGEPISYDLWRYLRRLMNWVCDHWTEPDEAIWEVRGEPREFVYSKLMCWVALDRALRLAESRSFPADWPRWSSTRDEMFERIMRDGWSDKRQSFVQSFGSDALDASVLMMPLVFFVAPRDPRMLKTLAAINRRPSDGGLVTDGLVRRYDADQAPDGLAGSEGTFTMCSFWLVEALTRAGRGDPDKLYEAHLMFERTFGYANHLGLFSEQIGQQGEALGNFPQALTHLGFISAAVNLDRELGPNAGNDEV